LIVLILDVLKNKNIGCKKIEIFVMFKKLKNIIIEETNEFLQNKIKNV